MEEQRPNTCTAVVATTSRSSETAKSPADHGNSSSSYFWVITVPQPKVRIRIPRWLAKATQRRRSGRQLGGGNGGVVTSFGGCPKEGKKKRCGFGGFLSRVFSSCKRRLSASGSKQSSVAPWEFQGNGGGGGYVRKGGEDNSLPKSSSVSFERLLGDAEYKIGRDKGENGGDHQRSSKLVSFSGLFSKGKAWNFLMRRRINKNGQRGRLRSKTSRRNTCPSPNAVTQWASNKSIGGSSKFTRIPSRILTTRPRLKLARSLRNMARNPLLGGAATSDDDEERRGEGEELCKKKILLGGKCKPLIHTGVLGYHEDCIWFR